MSGHNYRPDHDSALNQQFVDALRECLGKEPLYAPVQNLTRQCSPTYSMAHGETPLWFLKSDTWAARSGGEMRIEESRKQKRDRARMLHLKGEGR